MRKKCTLLCYCALLFAGAAVCDPIGLKPGKFAVRVVSQMGRASGNEAGELADRCISAADLKNPEVVFNDGVLTRFKPDPKCKMNNLTVSAGKASYDLACEDRSIHVSATYSENHFEVIRVVKLSGFESRPSLTTLSGHRVGDCK
jgi:hypothetical protein